MRKLAPVILLAAAAACTGGDRAGPADVEAYRGEPPISAPWLRGQLPAGTLVYQRIPHPLGLMAMPKGNLLDTALGSDANMRNLISLQQGLAENLANGSPVFANPMARLLLEHLRSPIEVAVTGEPAPSALIGASLSLGSAAEVEALLAGLSAQAPVALAGPLDAEGFGQLVGLPVPVLLHFDAASGRLALYGGELATRDLFARLLEPAADQAEHAMLALESEIDASGHGFFGWIDAAQALEMGALMMPPELNQGLQSMGAAEMRAVAFGAGVANGKGRFKILADLGAGGAGRPFPVVDNRIEATAAGEPRALFLVSIPSPAEFTRLETLVLAALPPEAGNVWAMLKQSFGRAANASIEEILAAIGPELMLLSDQAGDYAALRVRDRMLLDGVLGRLSTSSGVAIDERTVSGQTIRHVSLPGNLGLPAEAFQGEAALAAMLGRMRSRVYWVADGDYLYLAGLPQLLIDRARLGADTRIADWLAETQRVDLSASLLAATGSFARIPRLTYQAYLGMMQALADFAEVEYDIWSMPTPDQLGLPERGALALSLNLGDPLVSLEMSYESHPAEILYGAGGMASAAAIGVMAAIAIPAYQDYTIRAQVSEGLNLTAASKAAVAESYQSLGTAPADRVAAGMTPDPRDTQGQYVQSVDVADGQIVVAYGNAAHASIAGRALVQTPYLTPDGSLVWLCGYAAPPPGPEAMGGTANVTTIEAKYLPSACR